MGWLRMAWARVRGLFAGARDDRRIEAEVREHLHSLAEAHVRRGVAPDEAWRLARLEFGGVEQLKAAWRDQRGLPVVDAAWQDLRYAARMLRKSPSFTAAAIVTLTLGIGANTAIFSVINAVMVQPLPYPEPDRLMSVLRVWPDGPDQRPTGRTFDYLRDFAPFERVAARRYSASGSALSTGTHAETVDSASVSADYFRVLGVEPTIGRSFTEDEDRAPALTPTPAAQGAGPTAAPVASRTNRANQTNQAAPRTRAAGGTQATTAAAAAASSSGASAAASSAGAPAASPGASSDASAAGPAVVIISHALWQRLFDSDPGILGRTVLLGGRANTIVGVASPAFVTFPRADIWTPLRRQPGTTDLETIGRLRAGVTRAQAAAALAALSGRVQRELPPQAREARGTYRIESLQESMVHWIRPALLMLSGAVGLVLLIACANIASLLLVRATGRRREIATRAALGARRTRILRQLLTEAVLLGVLGGALGVLVAYLSLQSLVALAPFEITLGHDVAIDRTVLLAAFGLSVLTGIVFGVVPAIDMARLDVRAALLEGDGRTTAGGRTAWLRHGLVIAQVALCVTLLAAAGLLMRTFVNLTQVPPGIDVRRVMTAEMSLRDVKEAGRVRPFYERTLAQLRAQPGIEAAAVMSDLPLTRGLRLGVRLLDAPDPTAAPSVDWRYVSADFLSVLRVPVIAGRALGERDTAGSAPVALVNQAFARQYGDNPGAALDRMLQLSSSGSTAADRPVRIVGVIADIRSSLRAPVRPTMYVPVEQAPERIMNVAHGYFPVSWIVRTRDDRLAGVAQALREAVRAVEPQLPLSRVRSMQEVFAAGTRDARAQMVLLGIFAGIALALAAAGLYGLVAYTVVQRRREIGIHMALGATAGVILRRVVARGLLLTVVGLVVGLGGAAIATRWLEGFVFGIGTRDPLTFAGTALFLLTVAIAASLVPAVRASRINPMATLRNE